MSSDAKFISQEENEKEMSCNVLRSLNQPDDDCETESDCKATGKRKSTSSLGTCCPKQLQLPMFLSKTYHMIDKCDPAIATWSDTGDNFVVKNVEKFAGSVLPLYFKHSNFSSFARQLNFYGFRKLRTDPILTSEVDPGTACYVRFYHEHFQRNKPELLQQIKRATKGDQQSKDDVDSLRSEISKLKAAIQQNASEYDRKLAELSYDCNRRIAGMQTEHDKLLNLVRTTWGAHAAVQANPTGPLPSSGSAAMIPPPATTAPMSSTASSASVVPPSAPLQIPVNADLLHSLSQAAVSLQDNARANMAAAESSTSGGKRPAPGESSGDVARARVDDIREV